MLTREEIEQKKLDLEEKQNQIRIEFENKLEQLKQRRILLMQKMEEDMINLPERPKILDV